MIVLEHLRKRGTGWEVRILLIATISVSILSCEPVDSLRDDAGGGNWAGYGRSYAQQHYSPLNAINAENAYRMKLMWWFDIPAMELSTSVPLEMNGTIYLATGYSVVRALDASTGQLRWQFDPQVASIAGYKLRTAWGIRGLAFWHGKVYVGTDDGRLIALDSTSGNPVWKVETTEHGDSRSITGPPLALDNKIVVGHGGAEWGPVRGYVTAYDADTGQQLWRFFTVPGDPTKGFENGAMTIAAKTWTGRWWRDGGGGTVWNAITYDQDLNRIYIGTGNGTPTRRQERSPDGGDNLFLASIIALDATSGSYIWHYQTTPGENWDYDATTDIELATLRIGGKSQHVLMQASKNGFFYVLDRRSGKLLSARKYVHANWAEDDIDLTTGRPVETPRARDEANQATIWPHESGGHGPQPMAFSPRTGLVYIPAIDGPVEHDRSNYICNSRPDPDIGVGVLIALDPATQQVVWRVPMPGMWNGGVLATAGNLVFQGRCDGKFVAYSSDNGRELWSFDAQVGIVGAPITYSIGDMQFVVVVVGYSGGTGAERGTLWTARGQRRRVLAFGIKGPSVNLPNAAKEEVVPLSDSDFHPDTRSEQWGELVYEENCIICHGNQAIAGGAAPDLRASPIILSRSTFRHIVIEGALLEQGMPKFEELSDEAVENLRQYLRARAAHDHGTL